jgi:mono/diheme cytochrome c family protein
MLIVRGILGVLLALALHAGGLSGQQGSPAPPPPDGLDYEMFKAEIQPMFIAKREGLVRCVQCHGRGAGAGGLLILSPAEGSATWTEEESRKNFDAVRRFVAAGNPEASRLLMHPLARSAGGDPFHGGGKHWMSKDDGEWRTLARWVNTGKATHTTAAGLDFEAYRSKIEPIFIREREGPTGKVSCAGCHSGIATRLKLAAPPESGAWSMEQSRQNFAAVSGLVVAGKPLESRLLLHPLDAAAGGDASHSGGKFWKSQDDPEWQALSSWVRAATPAAGSASSTARPLDYEFFKERIQPIFTAKRTGLVRCTQCHTRGTGSGFSLAPLAEGATTWTEEEARKNFDSASRMVVPGEPTASRLLMHPLARAAGGDPFHGGGKHWSSQSDSEWQTLAAWVRGATTTSR